MPGPTEPDPNERKPVRRDHRDAGAPGSDRRTSPPPRPVRPENAIRFGDGVWTSPDDLRWSFARSGGPGGQNVNKVSSKAELRLSLSALRNFRPEHRERLRSIAGRYLTAAEEILITADDNRSQLDNRAACLARLRSVVEAATTRPKTRKKTKPSRGSKERRLKAKRVASDKKQRRNWKSGGE
ncbi:MAG: aminoacyl-tRNA hydrolase [Phycisphaera sp. TMED9]|nr:MAG: aminoacyl-tRNA hydrolase [Phycisphaera sp. TMED9]